MIIKTCRYFTPLTRPCIHKSDYRLRINWYKTDDAKLNHCLVYVELVQEEADQRSLQKIYEKHTVDGDSLDTIIC